MRPDTDDPSFVQHDDLVGIQDGADALGNDHHRRAAGFARERRAEPCIGAGIECREAVIKQIDGRTLHQGAGKTTLLNLIPRLFDVSGGAVIVNGVDVRQQRLETLWQSIGLIPQQAYLFRGTIAENLRFGNPSAPDADLWHALEVAQAHDFVSAMPGQLDAPVDQGGTNFSGGQRQRLAIARALVKRPVVYLFDDCFSALDAGTDARLRAALTREARGATVVIVAQRVSTILNADQIIVLDEGRIAGIGTHQELMASTAAYREIVASQLGEEAVA